ncbi:MAG: CPBP family intramembrane metalloprotease [Actinomycetota bacterium]|nr:CPBP family intramembrane metalloprotease [Actinomycetota bacterium]
MGLFFEEGKGRFRALWRLVFQYLTNSVAVPLFANLLVVAWLLVRPGGGGYPGGLDVAVLSGSPLLPMISSVAGLAGAILSVWLAVRFLDRRPIKDLGFSLGRWWWLDLSFGMALGALLMTTIFLVESGLGWISVTGAFETRGTGAPFALYILLPAAAFVCVGISEETVSRGYQLRNAAEGLNHPAIGGPRGAVLAAWVLSSIFFGALHAGNPNATALSTFNIILAGLMLGFGYVLSGQLAIPIGLHITWNFFQNAVYGLPVSGFETFGASFLSVEQKGPNLWTGGPFGPEGGLLAPAAMLLGVLLMALWVRLRGGKLSLHAPIAAGRPDSRYRVSGDPDS